jgi:hypothetical protein
LALAGAGNFRIGYLGVSAYGNDTHMDDVSVAYTPGTCTVVACSGCTVPAAPTAVSATAGCTGNSVSWTNAPTATSHNVLRGTACGTVLNTFTNVTSPYNDTSAVAGTAYYYWVVGINSCGTSANSSCSAATTRLDVPAAPTISSVTDVDACAMSGVTITWGAVSGATGYDLYVDSISAVPNISATTYVYTPGDTNSHNYQVRAKNACGNGSLSTASAGTDAVCTAPPEIAAGTAYPGDAQSWAGQVQSWPSTGTATGYRLWKGLLANLPNLITSGTDFCDKDMGALLSQDCTLDDASIAAGRCYYYLVTPYNGGGQGSAGTATAGARVLNTTGTCP